MDDQCRRCGSWELGHPRWLCDKRLKEQCNTETGKRCWDAGYQAGFRKACKLKDKEKAL